MMTRPRIGTKYRSSLTGKTARVLDTQGDIIYLTHSDCDDMLRSRPVHIRDFNAEYRLDEQQRAMNR